jgi:hypothetical protein
MVYQLIKAIITKRKNCLLLILATIPFCTPLSAQQIQIKTDSLKFSSRPEFKPGFFYNNINSLGYSVFAESDYACNTLRFGDLEWYLRSSTGSSGYD